MQITRFLALSVIALFAGSLLATESRAHSTLEDITQGDEERVTLPVLPESKLIIHATRGIDVSSEEGAVQSLPLAVFLTRKTPKEVEAWYREQLPDYTTLRKGDGREAQILESTSDTTKVDSPDTYRIPNIRIRPTDERTATHLEGAKTMLQIYYEAEPDAEQ